MAHRAQGGWIGWITIVIDAPMAPADADVAIGFWEAATGTHAVRGDQHTPIVFRPSRGDPCLQMADPGPGSRFTLHVSDVAAAAATLRSRGAHIGFESETLFDARSPAGTPFSVVEHRGERAIPEPVTHPDGALSRLDQVSIDVPMATFDEELCWWSDVTGWPPATGEYDEFHHLRRPDGMPVRILVQRLDTSPSDEAARCHLDFSCSDRDREVARHVTLGAAVEHRFAGWTVLHDPLGMRYCITDRDPLAGRRKS